MFYFNWKLVIVYFFLVWVEHHNFTSIFYLPIKLNLFKQFSQSREEKKKKISFFYFNLKRFPNFKDLNFHFSFAPKIYFKQGYTVQFYIIKGFI